ncbi:glycoside hydrolase family 53 protein [Corallibacter sp.]|uniref:glycoside hydrolase family 53 protein n=1 Tax=Corallibacter sp. TaxID=2038084 RepID=UPI003AB547D3
MKYLNFKLIACLIAITLFYACSSSDDSNPINNIPDSGSSPDPEPEEIPFFYGADLSYVNQMEDCGITYKNENNQTEDPFAIFSNSGANLVRVRLWHNPTWTNYSNYDDVKLTIQRAKSNNMKVLLDFHYSDTWADPDSQEIPAAWASEINNTEALGQLLYDYTYNTLNNLASLNLLPDMVQVGNEINGMILQQGDLVWPIDWSRNSHLINKGIQAVRDISEEKNKEIGVMLHIAQPENGLWWFEQATENGVTDFDWIGLSYYPIWSEYNLNNLGSALSTLINTYNKQLMIVETAYPFTLDYADSNNNILGENALVNGYEATQQGQLNYLNQLKSIVESSGGKGVVYWEPAWVSATSNGCQGSAWENAALFDFDFKATLGMQFYNGSF